MNSENRWSNRTRFFSLMLALILLFLTGCTSREQTKKVLQKDPALRKK